MTPGTKLGPYEILSQLGAGGMGEVYKARDMRLDRIVAVKVMPKHIATHEDLRQRFEREARAVSSLNHPHICVLHDVGKQDGVDYMVLEHLDGETLAARLVKGPLPLDQVFRYAIQTANALDRAHRSGVYHRDVKPSNIMLTRDGVKVLDFGLAKTGPKPGPADETLTAALTSEGTVLGTPQYMAPELFEGKEADARSDIFGFGCVVYEMVTGKRAFDGKTRASVVGAILGREPPSMSSLQPVTPPALESLVRGCLVKDPEERYQSLWDVLLELRKMAETRDAPVHSGRSWLWPAVAGLCLVLATIFAGLWWHKPKFETATTQFTIDAPPNTRFPVAYVNTSVSPDGRFLVFQAGSVNDTSLWLRSLDSATARPLPGTENGTYPFWSPDSKAIAFFAGGKLRRIDPTAGKPQALCDAPPLGGTWSRDGSILFGRQDGLYRISASGGMPARLTQTDASRQEGSHRFPQFLPDGKRFLYLIQSANPSTRGIYAGSLDSPNGRVRLLETDTKAAYTLSADGGPGVLLFLRDQALLAQRLDASLRLEGDSVLLADNVALPNGLTGAAAFSTSDTGALVYRTGELGSRQMVKMARNGKRLEAVGRRERYESLRLSPDGATLAFDRYDAAGNEDVWLLEFGRAVETRLTVDSGRDASPVWSPDGHRIAFSSDRGGVMQLYWKAVGGGAQEEQLTDGPLNKFPRDWSPDGRYLLYMQGGSESGNDLLALPLEGPADRKPIAVAQTRFNEPVGQFSPDGKWVAYHSNESGKNEVYVQPFPPRPAGPSGKVQVSNQGGLRPRWRGDGKELFYLAPNDKLMAATIRTTPVGIQSDPPNTLFGFSVGQFVHYSYDVTSNGQEFFVLEATEGRESPLTVVLNWQARLKK